MVLIIFFLFCFAFSQLALENLTSTGNELEWGQFGAKLGLAQIKVGERKRFERY